MLRFPKDVTYNLGDMVTIIIESDFAVSIKSLLDPNLNELFTSPLNMKNIKDKLYIGKIQLTSDISGLGTYICQIGSVNENEILLIRVVKPNSGQALSKRVVSPD